MEIPFFLEISRSVWTTWQPCSRSWTTVQSCAPAASCSSTCQVTSRHSSASPARWVQQGHPLPEGSPEAGIFQQDHPHQALKASEEAHQPAEHRDHPIPRNAGQPHTADYQVSCQGGLVHPMEEAFWGECCCPWGHGSLCGLRCQGLTAQVAATCHRLLALWTPPHAP